MVLEGMAPLSLGRGDPVAVRADKPSLTLATCAQYFKSAPDGGRPMHRGPEAQLERAVVRKCRCFQCAAPSSC